MYRINFRKIAFVILIMFAGVAVSCKEEVKKEKTPAKTTTNTIPKLIKDNSSESNGEIALNPAHGQPGHRCDIAVGAPLNSDSKTDKAANQGSPLINAGNNLNPAHGQPGHRCDIAVGAPLDSKPSTNASSEQNSSPLINSGNVKLNPAHGQPGHRCDIKVGDPLQ